MMIPKPPSRPSSSPLLLTLDAFETLFHPRQPVPVQYAHVAQKHLNQTGPKTRTKITPEAVALAFKPVFKAQSTRYPNYGREEVLKGASGGPSQWWEEVIRGSFGRILQEGKEGADIPDAMVKELLGRFAGKDGYDLYPDVKGFLARIADIKKKEKEQGKDGKRKGRKIVLGVISNSDDRVPFILRELGVRVAGMRAEDSTTVPGFEGLTTSPTVPSTPAPPGQKGKEEEEEEEEDDDDISLVITSYQAGVEKPDPAIFDSAKRKAMQLTGDYDGSQWQCVHVGDDLEKDYRAAISAGWESYFLPRSGNGDAGGDVEMVRSLGELVGVLGLEGEEEVD